MQRHAYHAMQRMQEQHWWWQGMRTLYRSALSRFAPTSVRYVIDVGCGFGANLAVLNAFGAVVGVDVSLDALRAISNRPALGLVQARADALPFRAGVFDIIGLLAVVEHVDRDDRVLSETYRVARPGAVQILLTSALMLLWSHHDVANEHRRRYTGRELDAVQRAGGWRILTTSYANAFIFPAVAAIRVGQRLATHADSAEAAAYDMGPNLGPFNRVMGILLALEAWLITHNIRLPFGVDLFSVARCGKSTG